MDEQILFANRSDFREWLINNHHISNGIWLIFGKSGKLKSIKPDEAVEEALCFGWIDGQFNSIDETKYLKKFTPRRKDSKWSEKNRGITEKLVEQGQMTDQGFSAIEQAKKDGVWDIPKADPISDEQISAFVERLKGFEPAFSNFQKMSQSVRGTYIAHYSSAKLEETKIKRFQQIVARLNENRKPM